MPVNRYSISLILILIGFSLLSYFVFAQSNQTYNVAISRGINYFRNSDPSIWYGTDLAAIKILLLNFRNTVTPFRNDILERRQININDHPFLYSILQDGNYLPPGENEVIHPTAVLLHKILTCGTFTQTEITTMGNAQNVSPDLYGASHSVFFLKYIKDHYGVTCGQPLTATQAGIALTTVTNNGLILPQATNGTTFDAYLEQECARGLVTGTITNNVANYVVSNQDANFGGWWKEKVSQNPPYFIKEIDREYWYYPELPSGHTSAFAMCILLKKVNAT